VQKTTEPSLCLVSQVITINAEDSYWLEYGRESIYDGEKYGYPTETIIEIVEAVLGEGTVKTATYDSYETNKRGGKPSGKRNDGTETNRRSQKNVENDTNEAYSETTRHSLKGEYWHTDLSKAQLKEVEKWIHQAGNPEATKITDTANWYKGRIKGRDLFVIYSTENVNKPTILYEVSGGKASVELDILQDLLEDEENGKSTDRKPSFTQRISEGSWMQNVDSSQNNLGNLGRGKNNQNAGVLQGQSKRNGSGAFWSVLENLFDIQEKSEIVDLTDDKDLSVRIKNQRGSEKYKTIRDYILETLREQPITLSDGIVAKVDRSDALHIANKSANRKTAYISKIKDIIEKAKFYAADTNVEHNKFDEFRYYQVNVKYGNEMYPVYLNVGHSKNGDGYHIYDITRKIGAIAKQKNALERVENDLRSEIDSPILNKSIPQTEKKSQGERNFSLKGSRDASSKRTSKFLDAVEDLQKGKQGASERLAKYVDSGMIRTDEYDELIEKYGAISRGERPHRDVQVPKKTSKDKKVSQTVRTILEAGATPDEAVPTIEKMVEDGIFSYETYSDKQAINDADSYIKCHLGTYIFWRLFVARQGVSPVPLA